MRRFLFTAVAALTLFTTALLATGCGDDNGANAGLIDFLETYQQDSAETLYGRLKGLTVNDHTVISVFGALASDVYLRACYHQPQLIAVVVAEPMNCQMLAVQRQNALGFITPESLAQNIETQRLQVLNGLRCANGEHDRQTCAVYASVTGQVSAAQNDTSMQIIANMSDGCVVGKDPLCFP